MKLRHFYLLASTLGALWPLFHLVQFVREHSMNATEFFAEMHASPAADLFVADVLVSALVLVVFVRTETRRLGLPRGRLALLGLVLGVSLALPWFLYLRQRHLDGQRGSEQAREALA
jgi:hypothetical protein